MRSQPWILKRTRVLMPIGLAALCLSGTGCGHPRPKEKVYTVGVLEGASFFAPVADGLKAGLTELGYVEGKTITYDIQKSDIDLPKYQEILKRFVAEKVDLIFSFPTEASLEAKAAAQPAGIPVVFSIVNIEDNNVVNSVREPGGNITGVRYPGPSLTLKRLEILHRLVPDAKRVLVAYQLSYPVVIGQLKILRPAAASLGITLVEVPVESGEELQAGLDAHRNDGIEAVLLIDGPTAVLPATFIQMAKFAADLHIPMGGLPVSAGGYETVFGVSTDTVATGRQAAILVDKIFRGFPAGTIPVVSAESFFEINYREAQKLGLTVSEGLLSMADRVIH